MDRNSRQVRQIASVSRRHDQPIGQQKHIKKAITELIILKKYFTLNELVIQSTNPWIREQITEEWNSHAHYEGQNLSTWALQL